jgi:hypothetical protein
VTEQVPNSDASLDLNALHTSFKTGFSGGPERADGDDAMEMDDDHDDDHDDEKENEEENPEEDDCECQHNSPAIAQ